MTPAERRRLVGILGRLASDYDGERAAAGLLASRMLKSAGVTWEDVIPDKASRTTPDALPVSSWRIDLSLCQRHISFLRPWEQDFTRSIAGRSSVSPKQRFILSEIAAALRLRGKS